MYYRAVSLCIDVHYCILLCIILIMIKFYSIPTAVIPSLLYRMVAYRQIRPPGRPFIDTVGTSVFAPSVGSSVVDMLPAQYAVRCDRTFVISPLGPVGDRPIP